MDVTDYVVFAIFGLSTLAAGVMLVRMAGSLTDRNVDHRLRWSLNFAVVTGIWELSVAAVLIDQGGWSSAIAPGLIGMVMIAARWVVPAFHRRLNGQR